MGGEGGGHLERRVGGGLQGRQATDHPPWVSYRGREGIIWCYARGAGRTRVVVGAALPLKAYMDSIHRPSNYI